MKNLQEYLNSGILELYVLGLTSVEENLTIADLAEKHSEINEEIDSITDALIQCAEKGISIEPNGTVRPMIMAVVDYMERLKGGEEQSRPPLLSPNSKIEDYSEWVSRIDMVEASNYDNIYAKIIGYDPQLFTAIVWIKDATPYEIHNTEFEKFLILEGTCDIITESKTYHLKTGDNFTIPLHEGHVVKVTSSYPCKVILQREAA